MLILLKLNHKFKITDKDGLLICETVPYNSDLEKPFEAIKIKYKSGGAIL